MYLFQFIELQFERMDVDFEDHDVFYKIIVIGDAGVGKTNLIHVFDKGRRPLTVNPTIGSQFTSKTVKLPDSRRVRAQIWDTAGQQQFRSVTMSHYRGAVGALIVFDLTNRNSFQHVKEWFGAVRERAEHSVQVGLIGNKSDSHKRAVSKSQAQKFAKHNNIFYLESSAQNPESVREVFNHLLGRVMDTHKVEAKGTNLKLEDKPNQSSCKC